MKTRTLLAGLLLLSGLFLASCVKEDSPTPATHTPDPTPDSAYHLNAATMLQLINAARQSGCTCGTTAMPAVPPLSWNSNLAAAADGHSLDMEQKSYFSHTGSDGSDPGQRITAAGYIWTAYGENIANGYPDESTVMQAWLKSEGHCRNIMSANYTEIGVAREGNYWTQDFGNR